MMKRTLLTLCIIVAVLFSSAAFAAYALILNGQVVQVSDQTFPVHPDLEWVECSDEVKPGWVIHYVGVHGGTHVYEPPVTETEPAQTIEQWRATAVVGPMALAEKLAAIGLFDAVNTWANAQGGMVSYAWNRATEFQRLHPMVIAAQKEFGWTDEQTDELFK